MDSKKTFPCYNPHPQREETHWQQWKCSLVLGTLLTPPALSVSGISVPNLSRVITWCLSRFRAVYPTPHTYPCPNLWFSISFLLGAASQRELLQQFPAENLSPNTQTPSFCQGLFSLPTLLSASIFPWPLEGPSPTPPHPVALSVPF